MLFKTVEHGGNLAGFISETPYAVFFFGTKYASRSALPLIFPNYRFVYLKQVHGRAVISAATDQIREADGHFTREKNLALVSQTADCVPVLLAGDDTVCAIHSGWRGTAQNITDASKVAFGSTPPTTAAIGPHILKENFEVGHDVANQLLGAATNSQGLISSHKDPAKTYFDLTEMIRRQLRDSFGKDIQIRECLYDTIADARFHSFRRDKSAAGRQYSFVVLKP